MLMVNLGADKQVISKKNIEETLIFVLPQMVQITPVRALFVKVVATVEVVGHQ